jgi:hypothetical protein
MSLYNVAMQKRPATVLVPRNWPHASPYDCKAKPSERTALQAVFQRQRAAAAARLTISSDDDTTATADTRHRLRKKTSIGNAAQGSDAAGASSNDAQPAGETPGNPTETGSGIGAVSLEQHRRHDACVASLPKDVRRMWFHDDSSGDERDNNDESFQALVDAYENKDDE